MEIVLPITLTSAAAAALINIWLALRVGQLRLATKTVHGDDAGGPLTRRMRAQLNFVENTAFVLILIAAIELAGNGGVTGHANAQDERLRLVAAQLSDALQRVEPNLRLTHASAWALDKRWIDCLPSERAQICAALYASTGRTDYPERLRALADREALRDAVTWGLSFRLARKLGGGSRPSLSASRLYRKKDRLVLRLDPSRAELAHYPVTRELEALASWLGVDAKLKIAPTESGPDEFED